MRRAWSWLTYGSGMRLPIALVIAYEAARLVYLLLYGS